MKITKSAVCISMVLLLSGCTALLWSENKVAESHKFKVLKMQDNVSEIFQYKNLAASVMQGKYSTPLIIPTEGIAFLGDENIYILTKGAGELLSLNKITDKIPLISGREENTLKLEIIRLKKGDAIAHFKDSLWISVNKNADTLSAEDKNILVQSEFTSFGTGYGKSIEIEGVIIPKKSLNYSFSNSESLGRKYKVEFYITDSKTDFHPLNLATNIVFTPVALAADIVFLPISINFFRAVNNAYSFNH